MMKKLLLLTALILSGVLILSGCSGNDDTPPDETPDTPIETEITPMAADEVRDFIIDYLQGIDADHAPADGLEWTELDLTPEMIVGATTKAYESGDWTITVQYPIVAPENMIYTVTVNGGLTGWYWEGTVNADSEVTDVVAFTQITEEMSKELAEAYLTSSPTYGFDGMPETLTYVETLTLRCPYCWQFVFTFDSSSTGYGDRTGMMTGQAITPHRAVITVMQGVVTGGILDGRWDIETQAMIETGDATTEDMVQYATVADFLTDPVYETTISVEGEVSLLGELLCPCFDLTSGGESLHVWYGLMVENDGQEMPDVSVEGIANGDIVLLTGVLKGAGGTHYAEGDFWAVSIVKVN